MKKIALGLLTLFIGTALADSVPTSVGYVDSQIGTLQNKISAVDTNTVLTTTNTAGEIGQKSIYDATGNYVEQQNALVTAEVANAAVQNAIDTEFICTEWLSGAPHTNENCLIYTVRNPAPNRIVPIGYTPLEYIESTGEQYIDTGVTASSGQKIMIDSDLQFTTLTTYMQTNGVYVGAYFGAWNGYFVPGGNLSNAKPLISADTLKHNFVFTSEIRYDSNQTLVIDKGTIVYGRRDTQPGVVYIFGVNEISQYLSREKVYTYRVYVDGVLQFNGIPARRNSDGEIGMYDTVSNQFFTNSGTGEFIAGPEINGNVYLPQI